MTGLIADHLVSQKLAPAWFGIFLIWVIGSTALFLQQGFGDKATLELVGLLAIVCWPCGFLGLFLWKDKVTGKIDAVTKRKRQRETSSF